MAGGTLRDLPIVSRKAQILGFAAGVSHFCHNFLINPPEGKGFATGNVMKKQMRKFGLLGAAVLLAGCAGMMDTSDGSSSGADARAGIPPQRTAGLQGPVYKASQYDVRGVTITVPQTLIVSEANAFHPAADIVWRGEPVGDRHAQVRAILTEAMATGTAMMTKGPAVDVEVTLVRFHSVTEKTRYSVGGVHDMQFNLTVRDAGTGSIIDGPRLVIAGIEAAGGAAAIAEDAAGQTQRVVVLARLARAIRFELSRDVPPPGSDRLAGADTPVIGPQYH